jgi:hypothetical protein
MSEPDSVGTDFLALAQSGVALKTRDRRVVSVIAIDAAAGLIRGSIAMEGELSWRRDGSFTGVPLGVAGPLDLAPPPGTHQDGAQQEGPRRASLQDALNDGDAKDRAPFCCD